MKQSRDGFYVGDRSSATLPPASGDFWAGRRVLVTGHTGFKGSWLSLWLQQYKAEVLGFAHPAQTEPSLFKCARVDEGLASSFEEDVRDLGAIQRVMAQREPEVVFHLAAQPLVRYSYNHPIETYSTNVMGTVNVLEAARHAPSVRVVVVVTSDKCYENREWEWGYRENDPMGGYDPYSSSKGCAELVTAAYRQSYFSGDADRADLALGSVRAGNVIGGGDWASDRLVPDIVRAFIDGEPVHIRSPQAVRPWQHVLEPLSGYLRLAERLWEDGQTTAGGWNFGPREEDAQPVGHVVTAMQQLWGEDAQVLMDDGEHPHEATYLKLDCSKARSQLGWRPLLSLDTALTWTVDWYRAFQRGEDMRAFTLNQIRSYERNDFQDHQVGRSIHHRAGAAE